MEVVLTTNVTPANSLQFRRLLGEYLLLQNTYAQQIFPGSKIIYDINSSRVRAGNQLIVRGEIRLQKFLKMSNL